MGTAVALFECQGTPIVRVDLWSRKLNMWVYLVPQRTGLNPSGTLEVTPQDIASIHQWVAAGWPLGQAIQQITGTAVQEVM